MKDARLALYSALLLIPTLIAPACRARAEEDGARVNAYAVAPLLAEIRAHDAALGRRERELDERERTLDETDLTRARNQCVTQVLQETETTLDRAAQIGLLEVIGASDYWPSFLDRIEGVSLTDVQRYARRYLDPDRAVVGISRRNDGRQSQIDLAAL